MANKFPKIKDRVLLIAEKQEGNKQVFFKKVGGTYGNFTGKNKETPLNSDYITNILSIYNDINPEWLLTGKGDMLKSTAAQSLDCKRCEELQKQLEAKDIQIQEKDKQISQLIDHLANLPLQLDSTQIKKRGSSANTNDNAPSRPNI